jgi:hypothetical protein
MTANNCSNRDRADPRRICSGGSNLGTWHRFSAGYIQNAMRRLETFLRPAWRARRLRACISTIFPLLLLSCSHTEKLDLARLKLPPGFHIDVFADAPHARQMAFSPGGVLLVTDMSDGTVLAFPDPKHTGQAEPMVPVLGGLNAPHGIAFHSGKLYVAEINAVRRYDWDESQLRAGNGQKILTLPGSGGGHSTRTILFAHGKMYVAVGSSCNVCDEDDKRRAAVTEYNEDGSGERLLASGLRNAVGLAVSPQTKPSGRPTTGATGSATIFRPKK